MGNDVKVGDVVRSKSSFEWASRWQSAKVTEVDSEGVFAESLVGENKGTSAYFYNGTFEKLTPKPQTGEVWQWKREPTFLVRIVGFAEDGAPVLEALTDEKPDPYRKIRVKGEIFPWVGNKYAKEFTDRYQPYVAEKKKIKGYVPVIRNEGGETYFGFIEAKKYTKEMELGLKVLCQEVIDYVEIEWQEP
jgi:hypothetical protein